MSDGVPDRIAQLRARWQNDPSSRIFLQLAEEYRHLGRVQEALAVLEAGLKEHPGYLSALVAKGRCLLELGDAGQARGVLERVVQQDATQMVANKLLVRAYLETGEPARAGQRLDLYTLLNDSDPEIEELRRRVVAMSRAPRVPDTVADVFGPGGAHHPEAAGAKASEPPPPLPGAPPVFDAAPAGLRPRGEGNGSEPFPDLDPARSLALYLASLEAESIFDFGGRAAATSVVAVAEPAAEPAGAAAEPTTEPAAEEPEPPGEPLPTPVAELMPAAAVEPTPPMATATLGELYRRQGHLDEAERIFREVMAREPGNDAARQALAQLAGHRQEQPAGRRGDRPLDAAQLLAGLDQRQASAVTRKAYLLKSYLTRLRQARRPRPHVP
jgi:tetratricopeptide (TPR) repeat protein